jgi:hypothetical protein
MADILFFCYRQQEINVNVLPVIARFRKTLSSSWKRQHEEASLFADGRQKWIQQHKILITINVPGKLTERNLPTVGKCVYTNRAKKHEHRFADRRQNNQGSLSPRQVR